MKVRHILLIGLAVGLFQLAFTTTAFAYSLVLPDVNPAEMLPYEAEQDHFSGPACVQMALNTCPVITERNYNSQVDIYNNSILAHNTELNFWFSDPNGVKGALMDNYLSPCGNWVDHSSTSKSIVLGQMLYWMKERRYLTPVSIGSNEHWVTVRGYETSVVPTPNISTMDLLHICYCEPRPGSASTVVLAGQVWLSDPNYWGGPFLQFTSAWDGKYIAIIEPPEVTIAVTAAEWILAGPILPLERIEEHFHAWLQEVRQRERAREPSCLFSILQEDISIEKPVLVKAAKYSYYMIPFRNSHLAAIFNAYNGSFEEIRHFKDPQKYVMDPQKVKDELRRNLAEYKAEAVSISTPEFVYDPASSPQGRIFPTSNVQAVVKDVNGKEHELSVSLSSSGSVIKGLEGLPKEPKPDNGDKPSPGWLKGCLNFFMFWK